MGVKDVLLCIARSKLLELAALGHCASDALSKLKKGTGKLSSAPSADMKGMYPLASSVPQLGILREFAAESGKGTASPIAHVGDKAFGLDGPSSWTQHGCSSILLDLIFCKVWAGEFLWY